MKKYEFTGETKTINDVLLHRIKAIKDFENVKTGDLGGWIENYDNLDQNGNCWVYDQACVYDEASLIENAVACNEVKIFGKVKISGDTVINGAIEIHCKCGCGEVFNW